MLIPCAQCRRHVRSNESACPFCGAPGVHGRPRSSLAGRFSRAAVFAGLASCGAPSSPVTQPDRTTQIVDHYDVKPAPGMGTIRGSLRDAQGNPIAGYQISLDNAQTATTDAQGFYTFENVHGGVHEISFHADSRGPGRESQMADVKAGEIVRVELQLPAPEVYDPGMPAKPYGAPPARRRIV